jgi:acetyl-CoA carboxylase carboxyl transferase subunit alpha
MNFNRFTLDFEKPIVELEQKIEELERYNGTANIARERVSLRKKVEKLQKEIYLHLTTWQRVQLARHPSRPYSLDYFQRLATDFVELHGDRRFADDRAVVAGMAFIGDKPVVIVGQQKGRNTKENLEARNFGMLNPEGYRKALRIMRLAAKMKKPGVTFIDTPGAYPGIGAEERGQAEAIAYNIQEMMRLETPIVVVVIGEGGSGGALGIGVGDRVLMMENSVYSVISPEGCAAILWRDRNRAPDAAEALKIIPQQLIKLGIIDSIIEEPLGGAHRNYDQAAENVKQAVLAELTALESIPVPELLEKRLAKFAGMGKFKE